MITAVKNRIIQKSMLTRMRGQRSITDGDGFQNIYGSLLQSQRLTKFKQQQGRDKKNINSSAYLVRKGPRLLLVIHKIA